MLHTAPAPNTVDVHLMGKYCCWLKKSHEMPVAVKPFRAIYIVGAIRLAAPKTKMEGDQLGSIRNHSNIVFHRFVLVTLAITSKHRLGICERHVLQERQTALR